MMVCLVKRGIGVDHTNNDKESLNVNESNECNEEIVSEM